LVQVVRVAQRKELVEPMQAMANLPLFRAVELQHALQMVAVAVAMETQLVLQVDQEAVVDPLI
jgi:hypothetical protein